MLGVRGWVLGKMGEMEKMGVVGEMGVVREMEKMGQLCFPIFSISPTSLTTPTSPNT